MNPSSVSLGWFSQEHLRFPTQHVLHLDMEGTKVSMNDYETRCFDDVEIKSEDVQECYVAACCFSLVQEPFVKGYR